MPITIAPYLEKDVPEVIAFNQRLRAGGASADEHVFPETHNSPWLPSVPGAPVRNELFLAVEEGVVRGGFALKHQQFSFCGETRPIVFYHHPVSEGIVNKKYAQVGLQMLMHVTRAHPLLFALGMGGYDRPLPKMLMALKWSHTAIPFYVRVHRPARFLRNVTVLRGSAMKRLLADAAAFSGAGWVAIKVFHAVGGFAGMRMPAQGEIVPEFAAWADEIWERCTPLYGMMAVRDTSALRTLYPASNPVFTRLKISSGGRILGWAVTGVLHRPGHVQYGDLRVGTILDGLSAPADASAVIAVATRALMRSGADVILSNQSHEAWREALQRCGFIGGPSNYIFAVSKKLGELLEPFEAAVAASHINRGDGDNLLQYR